MQNKKRQPSKTPSLAKLFWNGKSQAVRLPKAFRFEGDEVVINKEGNKIILSPKPKRAKKAGGDWANMLAQMPLVDDDFMKTRPLNKKTKSQDIF